MQASTAANSRPRNTDFVEPADGVFSHLDRRQHRRRPYLQDHRWTTPGAARRRCGLRRSAGDAWFSVVSGVGGQGPCGGGGGLDGVDEAEVSGPATLPITMTNVFDAEELSRLVRYDGVDDLIARLQDEVITPAEARADRIAADIASAERALRDS